MLNLSKVYNSQNGLKHLSRPFNPIRILVKISSRLNEAACEKQALCLFTCKILNLKPSGANFSANTRRQSNFCTPEFGRKRRSCRAHIYTHPHITMNYSPPQKCNSFSFKVGRAAYWKGGEIRRHTLRRESECRNSGANDFPCNLARDHHFSSSYCVLPLLASAVRGFSFFFIRRVWMWRACRGWNFQGVFIRNKTTTLAYYASHNGGGRTH